MVLTHLPLGSFVEMIVTAALREDPFCASDWPRECAMYRALELSAFDVSAQHCIMTGLLFKEVIGALVATLNCRMAYHQVQALIITSEVTAALGNEALFDALLPYGFNETEPGLFHLWLNNPNSAGVDIDADTREAITELTTMYPVD